MLAAAMVAAFSVGWIAARWRTRTDSSARRGDADARARLLGAPATSAEAAKASVPPPPKPLFGELPLALGDVVSAEGEERWLSGALVAREGERLVAVLFVAPEGRAAHAVAAYPPPHRFIHWLAPTELELPDEPPATMLLRGRIYIRRARYVVRLERLGQGAPGLGGSAVWALYEATEREVALVLSTQSAKFAWSGTRVEPGDYDRLGSAGGQAD